MIDEEATAYSTIRDRSFAQYPLESRNFSQIKIRTDTGKGNVIIVGGSLPLQY